MQGPAKSPQQHQDCSDRARRGCVGCGFDGLAAIALPRESRREHVDEPPEHIQTQQSKSETDQRIGESGKHRHSPKTDADDRQANERHERREGHQGDDVRFIELRDRRRLGLDHRPLRFRRQDNVLDSIDQPRRRRSGTRGRRGSCTHRFAAASAKSRAICHRLTAFWT